MGAGGTGPLGTTINNNNIVININKNYQGKNNGASSKVLHILLANCFFRLAV